VGLKTRFRKKVSKITDRSVRLQIQNERLREGELDVNEAKTTIRLLQQVQQELETKTQFLEKERNSFMQRSKDNAEEREILKRK